MRSLFLALLLGNLIFFAIQQDLFGDLVHERREPERLALQIEPMRLKLIRSDADGAPRTSAPPDSANAAATPAAATTNPASACVELGGAAGLTAEEVKRVETLLAGLSLAPPRVATRKSEDNPGYVVNLPPFKSKADADRAATELRRIGVEDFFVIQDSTPLKFGISLGVFKSEDAAKAHLTALTQRGVRNARISPRPQTSQQRAWLQISNVDADLNAWLGDIRQQVPAAELRACR